jgi:hypothetical protein
MANYAKIDKNTDKIVNTQVMSANDPMDPAFIWENIDGIYCQDGSVIEIGCGFDGTNFTPPGGS